MSYHISRRWVTAKCVALGYALTVAAGAVPALAQQRSDDRPAAVTDSAIARGEEVFGGPANCIACHGDDATGSERAPDLTDNVWIRGSGTYEDILEQVLHGVPMRESTRSVAMPMRGWSPASDADVTAVTAYVWSLSRPTSPVDP